MSDPKIAVRNQLAQFQPGEEIAGAAQWQCDRIPETMEVRLLWCTTSSANRGFQDICVVDTVRFDVPLQEDTRQFRFTAPDAPYSFSGKLTALDWVLELVALPTNDNARIEIVIAPGGEKIDLGKL